MTTEERARMNEICAEIQEEKNYERFAALLRELSELISRKEERRFKDRPRITWNHNRPWSTLQAVANKIIPSGPARGPERVEISLQDGDYLFREVRIENSFLHPDGSAVGLKQGARLDVTFEADATDTVKPGVPAA